MSRRLIAFAVVSFLAGCTTTPGKPGVSWSECARSEAVAMLGQGIDASWPKAPELPAGESLETLDLGPDPPTATHDAFMRTLHLAPGLNAFYVHQSGGYAGVDQLYGPVSLQGHCAAPALGAP